MKATVLLADYAADAAGKLTVVGAGWSFIGPRVGPMAIAILLEVPWSEANLSHEVVVELQDPDGNPARVGPEQEAIRIESKVEVGRPAGHPPGIPFRVPIAINFGPIPFEPGSRYVWAVTVNGESREDWQVGFNIRPAKPSS